MSGKVSRNLAVAAVLALAAVAVTVGAQMHGRGMMGGSYADDGYGPGMMGGGYGPGVMGPGMGMMMGPGMMGGYGPGFMAGLDLSEDQREQIASIQQDVIDGMWTHMRTMHQQMPAMWKARQGEKIDVDEAMKAHEAMMEAGRAMMRQRLEAHNAMLDVLTDEQREQLREGFGRGGRGGYTE